MHDEQKADGFGVNGVNLRSIQIQLENPGLGSAMGSLVTLLSQSISSPWMAQFCSLQFSLSQILILGKLLG